MAQKTAPQKTKKIYMCKFACRSKEKIWESKGQSITFNCLDFGAGCPCRFIFSFYGWEARQPYRNNVSISVDRKWAYRRDNTKPGSTHKFVEKGIRFECRPQDPAAPVWTIDEPVPDGPIAPVQGSTTAPMNTSRPMK